MKGKTMYSIPQIAQYQGVSIVREDLLAGGTKSRFIGLAFKGTTEVCYASSHCGGGQVALAHAAKRLGKRCVIFTAARAQLHRRQFEAQALGAEFRFIRPGYQSVLNARLRAHCEASGATPAPFGLAVPGATDIIAEAASRAPVKPRYVWVSAGSGLLARSLRQAYPDAELHAVRVGAEVDVPGAVMHTFHRPYAWACQADVPFSIDQHYESKTYQMMKAWQADTKPKGEVLFWNTMSAPQA
jgi:cysteine synthase